MFKHFCHTVVAPEPRHVAAVVIGEGERARGTTVHKRIGLYIDGGDWHAHNLTMMSFGGNAFVNFGGPSRSGNPYSSDLLSNTSHKICSGSMMPTRANRRMAYKIVSQASCATNNFASASVVSGIARLSMFCIDSSMRLSFLAAFAASPASPHIAPAHSKALHSSMPPGCQRLARETLVSKIRLSVRSYVA